MEDFRGWKLALLTIGIFLFVTIAGSSFDRMLNHDGVRSIIIIATTNALTGIVVAGLFLELVRSVQNRRRLVQARLEVIADMNHHIRNALQVLTYSMAINKNTKETEMMRDSIRRIEWALREVLPGYLPETYVPHDAEAQSPAERH